MNKENFLVDEDVRAFILWLSQKLDGSFKHSYINQKSKKRWECNSIYTAYTEYDWPFSMQGLKGHTFDDSALLLGKLSQQLKDSIDNGDNEKCKETCMLILEWGGVLRGNDMKIDGLGNALVDYLKEAKEKLTTGAIEHLSFYQTKDGKPIYMNAGCTKIYSLYIDDFIIYDSRVGAALGLLVRSFCETDKKDKVPEILAFAYGNSRGKVNRNPSSEIYKFPLLRSGDKYNNHIENNLKANWLLTDLLLHSSSFSKLESTIQLRALESGLFMIGYCCN